MDDQNNSKMKTDSETSGAQQYPSTLKSPMQRFNCKSASNEASETCLDQIFKVYQEDSDTEVLKSFCFPVNGTVKADGGPDLHNEQLYNSPIKSSIKKGLVKLRNSNDFSSAIAEGRLRGGGDEQIKFGEEFESSDLLGLIERINQYKMRIQNDNRLENELKLYVQMIGKQLNSNDSDSEEFDLVFGIKKKFLVFQSKLKVLLLTGEAGIGKTLFCKYLQRTMLSDWDFQDLEPQERVWYPIYVDLLKCRHSHPSFTKITVSEVLTQELSLTEGEVKLLQESNSHDSPLLPRLLLIFDNYDGILQKLNPSSMISTNAWIENNFYMENGFGAEWKHVKILLTCRSEMLSNITQRDLLFGPLESLIKTAVLESFAEFQLQRFTDVQISSYLKKHVVFDNIDELEISEHLSSTSWSLVEQYEDLIESHGLIEHVRVPLNLFVLMGVLPDLLMEKRKQEDKGYVSSDAQNTERISNSKGNGLQEMTCFQLYQTFANKAIRKTVERFLSSKNKPEEEQNHQQEVNLLFEDTKKCLLNISLFKNNYILNSETGRETGQRESQEKKLLISYCPLLKHENDGSLEDSTFWNKSIQDFFVATKILEEILQYANEDDSNALKKLVLNQKLLTSHPESLSILQFLIDVPTDQTLLKSSLIKFIQKTRDTHLIGEEEEKENESEDSEKISFQKESEQRNHPLSIAAANSITILNALGYDFSLLDLSQICIEGANLSYGIFEGTNFTGANLKQVNFSDSWLKETIFEKAIMSEVNFGFIPDFPLDKEATSITHSHDGKFIAVGMRGEVIIFEAQIDSGSHFREVRRLKGHVGEVKDLSFSKDGNHLITCGQDRTIRIWNIQTGECLSILKGHANSIIRCRMSQDEKQILSLGEDGVVKKWKFSDGVWSQSFQTLLEGATNCEFIPNSNQIIFLGTKSLGYTLYDINNGKHICKCMKTDEEAQATRCSLNSEGKQALVGKTDEAIHVFDCTRGNLVKYLEHYCDIIEDEEDADDPTQYVNPSFSLSDDSQIISTNGNSLKIQEITGTHPDFRLLDGEVNHYSINPVDNNRITLILKNKKIAFIEPITSSKNPKTTIIKGDHLKGLNFSGTNIDHAIGLSEENIMIFDQVGDYKGFGKKNIQELILDNRSADLEEITKIDLSNRGLGFQCALIIGRSSDWINLKSLDLSKNDINDDDAVKLGQNESWANLQELVLNSNKISDKAVTAFASNSCWKGLRKLHLASNQISHLGAKALGANSAWENLEDIDLSRNKIVTEGAVEIGRNSTWKNLKRLNLSWNEIEDNGAIEIGRDGTWNCLEELNLSNNKVGNKTACEIGCNRKWTNLKVLSLERNNIGDSGASAISANETWINLEELYLFMNPLSERVSNDLKANKAWSNVKTMICLIKNKNIKRILEYHRELLTKIEFEAKIICDSDVIALGRSRALPFLQVIELHVNLIGDKGASALGKNTTWTNLKELSLDKNRIGDEGVMSIGSNTTWINLEELGLSENNIGDEGASALGKNTAWNNLKELALYKNRIGDEGITSIGSNTTWINLEYLWLSENNIGDKGASALGKNTTWTNLKELALGKNRIGDEGVTSIGSNITWINLEYLLLNENNIGDEGASALGKNTTWTNLKQLALDKNRIGDEGVTSIGSNITWINLEKLGLSKNNIGDEGASVLGKNTAWTNLKQLVLDSNRIGDKGVTSIGSNTTWINLEGLGLSENNIGDEGASALGKNTTWANLKQLAVEKNRIGDEGVTSIGSNTTWNNLEDLWLSENNIGDKGASVLGKNTTWTNLKQLALDKNRIGDKGVTSIGSNTTWINLEELGLSENNIGDKGASVLGKNTAWTNLKQLALDSNRIGDEGVTSIGSNTTWINLEKLGLSENNIGDEGASALGKNTTWANLKQLALDSNRIGDKGVTSIGSNTTWINLFQLNLKKNRIGDAGICVIGSNVAWRSLESLVLSANNVGDDGAKSIGSNTTWKSLRTLSLNQNQIGNKGAASIGSNLTWTYLKNLDLYSNKIGEEGIMSLAKNPTWTNLEELHISNNAFKNEKEIRDAFTGSTWKNLKSFTCTTNPALRSWLEQTEAETITEVSLCAKGLTDDDTIALKSHIPSTVKALDLSQNTIGDKGITCIAKICYWYSLRKLDLSLNLISDEGVQALGENSTWRFLKELNLRHNQIGDKGALLIEGSFTFRNLAKLDLSANKISDEGAIGIGKNTHWINLEELYLQENQIGDKGVATIGLNIAWKKLAKFEIHMNINLTEIGEKALKNNSIFGSFVCV